mmetsp:Transcript_53340/g.106051  ORF Transcript_53340/g.106051 Transcript_53340/m.106051 type:complete len:235 (+) Transcript_53340:319-1023(+)
MGKHPGVRGWAITHANLSALNCSGCVVVRLLANPLIRARLSLHAPLPNASVDRHEPDCDGQGEKPTWKCRWHSPVSRRCTREELVGGHLASCLVSQESVLLSEKGVQLGSVPSHHEDTKLLAIRTEDHEASGAVWHVLVDGKDGQVQRQLALWKCYFAMNHGRVRDKSHLRPQPLHEGRRAAPPAARLYFGYTEHVGRREVGLAGELLTAKENRFAVVPCVHIIHTRGEAPKVC